MVSPFKGSFKVTSPRGSRILNGVSAYHKGLDLVGISDITVYAIADGVISATPYEPSGFGYYVRQQLPDGRRIYYGHLKENSIVVTPGQQVKKGDKLGIMGSTGYSTGAHTHLEIRPAGTSSESLDISAFTGIPNQKGSYYYEEVLIPQTEEKEGEEIMTQEMFNSMMTEYLKEVVTAAPSDWSQNARKWAEGNGLIKGDQYGNKQYKKPATREELIQMLYRLYMLLEGN